MKRLTSLLIWRANCVIENFYLVFGRIIYLNGYVDDSYKHLYESS